MLLQKLIEKQKLEGLSDGKFALKLGISRQLWQATRTGKMRIGERLITGVLKAFPELTVYVLWLWQEREERQCKVRVQ